MKTVTITGYVYEYDHYRDGDPKKYSFYSSDTHSSPYCTLVGPASFEFAIPENFSRTQAQLAALEKEKATVRAEYLARVREIEDRISKLQALEMTVEAE